MIDLHAHVLPAIDDGPADLGESIELCRDAAAEGVRVVVATPHMFCGIGTDDLETIGQAADRLRIALSDEGIGCELRWAGEVRLVEDLIERIRRGLVPFYDPKQRYLLLEPPFSGDMTDLLKHTIFQLRLRGMVPVIAHPERIDMFLKYPDLAEQTVIQGAILQVTAASLLAGNDAAGPAWEWMRCGWVQVVAGDMHRRARPGHMAAAREVVRRRFDEVVAQRLFQDNPQRILNGEQLTET